MSKNRRLSAILLVCLLFSSLPTINAFDLPVLPAEFHGFVESKEKPAAVGTEIVARMHNEVRGRIVVNEDGRYGGCDTFDEKLLVQGRQDEIGDEITFWVNGVKADQTSRYDSGTFTLLNLSIWASATLDTFEPTNPYPSIPSIHNGTITPSYDINVTRLYTYPCAGTSGHTEYVKIWNSTDWNVTATWNSYTGDWHNLTFNNAFTLYANETYNYTIRTGSYPQIIHAEEFNATGGVITCSEFVDINGKRHEGWIPAIRLF